MGGYIVLRGLVAITTLLLVTLLLTIIPRISLPPLFPRGLEVPDREALVRELREQRKQLGLDKPLLAQYRWFITRAAKGDLGTSPRAKRPVAELISQRLPNSLKLWGVALGIAALIGVPLGVALRRATRGRGTTVAQAIALLGQSTPLFWLSLMLILLFAVTFQIFPPFGVKNLASYILPGLTLAWWPLFGIVGWLSAPSRHTPRLAFLRLGRFSGFYLPLFILAAILVETPFAWPGVGRLAFEAVMWRDFLVIQGVVLVLVVITVAVSLSLSVLGALVAPRKGGEEEAGLAPVGHSGTRPLPRKGLPTPLLILALLFLGATLLPAVFASEFAPHSPYETALRNK